MERWKFKNCPRCGGDMYIDRDYHGWYEQCLQCGYTSELKNISELKHQLAEIEKEPVRAARVPAGVRDK